MARLQKMGVMVGLDNLGMGYVAMTVLKSLPCNFVTLGSTFVRGVASDNYDRAIAESVLRMAGALGVGFIARGIEEEAVVNTLLALGCTRGQGYHFAPPMTSSDATAILMAGSVAHVPPSS